MTFSRYLQVCRAKLNFTQAKLVRELYNFDKLFHKLDTNTLGRWERAVTHTPISKKVKILHYFFTKFDFYFPFLEMNSINTIEQMFSVEHVYKFLGKHSKLVMSFPTNNSDEKDFKILDAKNSRHQETAFSTAINICDDIYGSGRFYTLDRLNSFSKHPTTLFLICEYKTDYFGHLFFIYLKQEIYTKVINFEMDYRDITQQDLASKDEPASFFSMGLFAMNERALARLMIRFYATLILQQKKVLEIGTLISDEDVVNIAKNFGLRETLSDNDLLAYQASLKEVLLTKQITKMLFPT